MQNSTYKHELLKTPKKGAILSSTLIKILETFRKAGTKALAESKRFDAPSKISETANYAKTSYHLAIRLVKAGSYR